MSASVTSLCHECNNVNVYILSLWQHQPTQIHISLFLTLYMQTHVSTAKRAKWKKKKSDDGNDASVSVGFREDELVSSESDSGHSDVFVLHEL